MPETAPAEVQAEFDALLDQDLEAWEDAVQEHVDLYEDGKLAKSEEVEKAGSGVMLAFWPDAATANKLAVTGGELAEELHVTLAYYGKELIWDEVAALHQATELFAKMHAPVSGTLGGIGRFPATPSSDGKDTAYLGFHSDGIQDFRRELVEMTEQYGVEPKKTFGYTPHMSLKFVAPHAPHLLPTPESVPVTFSEIVLSVGSEKTAYPLTGSYPGETSFLIASGSSLETDPEVLTKRNFEIEGEIVQKDDAKHLVFGWFSIVEINGRPLKDTQGDIITPETIEESAYDFVLNARTGGEMHESGNDGEVRGIGRLVESVVFTQEKQKAMLESLQQQGIDAELNLGCDAWWGGFFVEDPTTWEKITTGHLRAFSVGGSGKREKLEE